MTRKKTPGFQSYEKAKQDMFAEYMNYIKHHAFRERHIELLEECRDISGIEDMTNFDLFTAGGGCLLGVRYTTRRMLPNEDGGIDIGNILPTYTY